MDKLNILWDAHVVSNDGKNFLHNADPCHHIAVNMSKLIGCIMTSNVEHTDYILDGRISRYEFDMPYWQERLKDVDVLITDQSTHIRNLKVANPKVTIYMLTPFIDIQKHPKVEEPYRYYLRQTDSMLVADKVVAQSGFNAVEYVKQVNQLTGVDISDKILIWPWGYSQEEVDKYKNINSFAVPTIFFPNRITESTDNYHYREFADAIGMIPEDIAKKAIFIYRNPTRKVTANQVKTIKKLSKNRADIIPNKDLIKLLKTMDFSLIDDGFMSEETLASGIYGIGTILGPLDYQSTVSTANNVALKVISLLSQDYLIAEFTGIEVNEDKCGLCGLCMQSCPYNAITIGNEKISVDKFKCKGCGTCVSVCPTNAIEMNVDTSEKILKTIEVFSKSKRTPRIIAFCCKSCGYAAADDAGFKKLYYDPNIFIIQVPCTGRVDTNFIIKSLELGFDGVMIIGCRRNACRYIDGVEKIEKKIQLLKQVLGPKFANRIILKHMNAVEGNKFAVVINEFYNQLTEEIKYEA